MAQQGGGGQNLPLCPLFSLFFPPPSLNLLLLPSDLFAQEQDGYNIPHPRVGAGGGGKDAQKTASRAECFPPPRPCGRSSSCLHQQRMWLREPADGSVWKMKKFKTSPPLF